VTRPVWEFRILGTLDVRRDEVAVPVNARMLRGVLISLLLKANQAVPAEALAGHLWGVTPPGAWKATLRNYIRRLRRLLDPDLIETVPSGYLIRIDPQSIDLTRFNELTSQAAGEEPAVARELLGQALSLWRGKPMSDLESLPITWQEAPRLEERYLLAVEDSAEAALALNTYEHVIPDLTRLADERPTRERLIRLLMLALRAAGRPAEALAAFSRARRHLVDELGIEPGPGLQQLQQEILTAEPEPPAGLNAHRRLPMDIAEFTGREAELKRLHELTTSANDGTAPVIAVIAGMAGVGKTRFAVHAAHRLTGTGRFDEIQLWSDLRGFDPDRPPVDPAETLAGFLRLLGVPAARIPVELETRAALYRDRLAGKRALVLLDNAATEEQVRPLLPGTPGCLLLVTSRRSLAGLDGAHPLLLDVLPTNEAVELVARIAGPDRAAADPLATARVVELCGHLPIAVSVAARWLRNRPKWTSQDLVDRLRDEEQRLHRLTTGNRDVHAVFDLSYQALTPVQRRMFRLLGMHPGDDFAAGSAAALLGVTSREAETLLEELVDDHLLQQSTAGRYHFHDLLRPYARHLARVEETATQQQEALHRVLTWYLHTADAARQALAQYHHRSYELHATAFPQRFSGHDQALAWCEAERVNLEAVVRAAADHGFPAIAWQLPAALITFYYLRSHWSDWITTHRIALTVTSALGEQRGQAVILRGLGVAWSDLRRYPESIECHKRAQDLFVQVGDLNGIAWNLNNLGVVYVDLDQLTDAESTFSRALELFRQTGDSHGEGICLNNLGDTERRLGHTAQAVGYLEQALDVQRQMGDQAGPRFTLASLGDVHRDTGENSMAVARYREALVVSEAVGDQRTTARVLANLGNAQEALGDNESALRHLRQALTIFEELGDAQADAIRAQLT
jgi:DNA-binding SARP family transcriptional activator